MHQRPQQQGNRGGSTVAVALVFVACFGRAASSSQDYQGAGSTLPQRPPPSPLQYPPQNPQQPQQQQQQQQQQPPQGQPYMNYPPYRGPGGPGPGPQVRPSHPASPQDTGAPGRPAGLGGPGGPPGPDPAQNRWPPSGPFDGRAPPLEPPSMGYRPQAPGEAPMAGSAPTDMSRDIGGPYPVGQGGYGRPGAGAYPPPPQPDGGSDGGFLTRLTNRFRSADGPVPQMPPPQEGRGYPRALVPSYPRAPQRPGQQYPEDRVDGGGKFFGRIMDGLFQAPREPEPLDQGPPSFRPQGSSLPKKEEMPSSGGAQCPLSAGPFNPLYPPIVNGGVGSEPQPVGPGVPEVITVDDSIVFVLRPNELARKKKKFKQDGPNRLQVIATFDHCLTAFYAKDGKSVCLKTAELLEQNQHVMLPDAAKKVRYLRSDFKRKMESDGKSMTPEERVAALEENLRKVYGTVAMEGGIHMGSIGPAIEMQLDMAPLRGGVDDMTAALAWRAIPLTIFCAGYGNVAMEVLKRGSPRIVNANGMFTPHLRLVANFFRPDDTMTIIGMYDTVPLIHEGKKTGTTLMQFLRGMRQEDAFVTRHNMMLLGSELSDLGLSTGLSGVEDCISVGFLKLDEHVLEKIQRYAEAYDVVIIGDGDMSYANEILHEVVG